jgi:beta-lactamase regulating signal transducer with metallopeptidase domain
MVLLHELGHVARRDLWTSLAARVACLVHWFNPLVWWLRGRLMAQCEFACDAKVISLGADPAHYASALCDVAEAGALPRAALAMAAPATLRQRVERVIRCQRAKGSLLVGAALLLTVTASLALSVVRLSPPRLAEAALPGAPASLYTPEEIELRLTADPFPAD